MTTLKFITTFILITLCSCGQKKTYSIVDVNIARLNNKIISLANHLDNVDSCKQALVYLDSTTTIDNNCFQCYYNKLMFISSLNQYDKAVNTINECIRLKPNAHDLYLTGGLLYAKTCDSISAEKYFHKSLTILNPVLDTMNININNSDYIMLVGNKALNLIMLDNNEELNKLLKNIPENEQNLDLKKNISSMRNMNKNKLINQMTGNQYSR